MAGETAKSVDCGAETDAGPEIHQDDRGLIWPEAVAPFQVQLMAVTPDDDQQRMTVARVETELLMANVEVLYDDRRGRVGGNLKMPIYSVYPIGLSSALKD